MKRKIETENYQVTYTLIHKSVKNINLHINPTGEIVVSANPYVPIEKIDAFVLEKVNWILTQQKKMIERAKRYQNEDVFVYFGKRLMIHRIESQKNYVKLEENQCLLFGIDENAQNKALQHFIDETCKKKFLEMAHLIYDKMVIDYPMEFPTIKIRSMTSRWGSCTPAKKTITLNKKMIHYDPLFLEYVVLHEFAHFIQPNHSKSFYRVIEKYMPDYKINSKICTLEIDDIMSTMR